VQPSTATASNCPNAGAILYSDAQLNLAAATAFAAFALRGHCRGCRQADAQLGLALALQLALIQIEGRLCHCGCLALRGLVGCRCHRLGQLLPANKRRLPWVLASRTQQDHIGSFSAALLPWLSLERLAPDGWLQLKGGSHAIYMHRLHAEAIAVEAQSAAATSGGSGGGDM
jgi:hypothetical protein